MFFLPPIGIHASHHRLLLNGALLRFFVVLFFYGLAYLFVVPDNMPSHDDASDDAASPSKHPWRDAWRDVAPYLDLGWRLASAVAGPPLLGWGIDHGFGTTPWGMLVGAAAGLVGAVHILVTLYHTPPPSS